MPDLPRRVTGTEREDAAPAARDRDLVQIVDAALADAVQRAHLPGTAQGSWLACRPGCTPCCHGVFRISMLDAKRLQTALEALERDDPGRAEALRERARHVVEQLGPSYPGDRATGLLNEEEEPWDRFADLAEADGACPVLDPASGRCDLYAGRPMTCRIFGPPVRNEEGIGMCELCYVGASEAEVLHGEMQMTHGALEDELNKHLPPGETVIAWALLGRGASRPKARLPASAENSPADPSAAVAPQDLLRS